MLFPLSSIFCCLLLRIVPQQGWEEVGSSVAGNFFSSLVTGKEGNYSIYNREIQRYIKHSLNSSLASFFFVLTNGSFLTSLSRFMLFVVIFTNLTRHNIVWWCTERAAACPLTPAPGGETCWPAACSRSCRCFQRCRTSSHSPWCIAKVCDDLLWLRCIPCAVCTLLSDHVTGDKPSSGD